jgi:HD-GYP domain-containing protein (c-di-GMP phosphodiesterase class II)
MVARCVGAVGFLLAASSLAAFAPWHRSLSAVNLLLVLAAWVVVERVAFPVAAGSTHPTMLVFVPALFLLPTPIVPLVDMVAQLLRRAPDLIRRRSHVAVVPGLIVDSWYTVGPALVIVLAGAQGFAWSHWPVYAAALVAQLSFDLAAAIGLGWVGDRIHPRVHLPMLPWTYIMDVTLAPLGLVIAAAAVVRPGLILIALAPMGVLALFARERQQRLDAMLELSTAYRGTTLLLGDIVEADDHYTGIHSREVVDLSLAVADALGLDATRRRDVEFGALLHDVGKIRVPKEILNKPGKLDPLEWELVRRHTIEGEAMLRQVGGTLAALGPIVRASHERWDGAGYPDGLAGEQSPIEARIIATCDAFNAMTTDRPYRPALPWSEALAELRRNAGTQFDPRVAAALEQYVRAQIATAADHPEGPAVPADLELTATPGEPALQGYTAVLARL